jgi:hypothetical protein
MAWPICLQLRLLLYASPRLCMSTPAWHSLCIPSKFIVPPRPPQTPALRFIMRPPPLAILRGWISPRCKTDRIAQYYKSGNLFEFCRALQVAGCGGRRHSPLHGPPGDARPQDCWAQPHGTPRGAASSGNTVPQSAAEELRPFFHCQRCLGEGPCCAPGAGGTGSTTIRPEGACCLCVQWKHAPLI